MYYASLVFFKEEITSQTCLSLSLVRACVLNEATPPRSDALRRERSRRSLGGRGFCVLQREASASVSVRVREATRGENGAKHGNEIRREL